MNNLLCLRFLSAMLVGTAALQAADLGPTITAAAHSESGLDATPLRELERLVARAVSEPARRKEFEAGLADALQRGGTLEGQRFLCQQLAVIGGEECVPALAALLGKDETVGFACFALAKNPSPKANAALRAALGTSQKTAQLQVVQALGARRDPGAVPDLKRLTTAGDKAVAGAALVALGRIASPAALAALTEAGQRQDAALAADLNEATLLAAGQLAAAGNQGAALKLYQGLLDPARPDHVRRGAFEAVIRLDRPGRDQRLKETLAGQDPLLRRSAIAAIASLKGLGVSKRFAAALPKLAPEDQVLLIQAFAQRGEAGAHAAIQDQLKSGAAVVRAAAIHALGALGDASTVPVLAGVLQPQAPADELKAIELALAALRGGTAVDQALAAALRARSAEPRSPLLAPLVRRADRLSFATFEAEAAGSDPVMVRLAFQGLSRVAKGDDLPALLQALVRLQAGAARADAEAAVGQAIGRLGEPAPRSDAVRAALGQATPVEARCSLVRLLANCPDGEALAAVKTALGDPSPPVQDAANRTLADWPEVAAWDSLVTVYQQAASDAQRVLALRGLVRLLGEKNAKPDANLAAQYRALFTTAKTTDDRRLLLGALGRCASPEALQLAVAQLAVPGVRAEAEAAVRGIAEAIKAQHPQEAQEALQKLGAGK
jgi:hypothetical protein